MSQLPAKDQAVFRSIVKFYETKQYKKGVKAADSILKKHPEHGETLCMKGLTLSYLDKKEEAYELVRKGLKHDLRSHVCWHVFGLLYRQDRDYLEAVKCYKQALKYDPDNVQILRDLSLLQIHRRDLTGFAETRRKLLSSKPQQRLNWIGYAISEHLCKNYEFAWTCLENYENAFKDAENPADYEVSELFMYKASIMEEAGKLEEALECLKKYESKIVDKIGLLEMKARICMFMNRCQEASDIYRRLVKVNPEHHIYILALMASQPQFQKFWPALPAPKVHDGAEKDDESAAKKGEVPVSICSFPAALHPEGMPIWGWLPPQHAVKTNKRIAVGRRQHKRQIDTYEPVVPLTEEDEEALLTFFKDLQVEHEKSDSIQRLALYFYTGKRFQKRLDLYFRPRLRKGIPSLFRMLRPLYFQGKAALIEELLLQYVKNLEAEIPTYGPYLDEEITEEPKEESPSSLLFSYMCLAEHYDFCGETEKALEFADKAIEHTPTLVEIYACKARIYKHAGDLEESAKWFDEVRSMDLADRSLNTQAVRAFLRKDDVQGGMEKALLFSKEPDSPEAANLHDMQCMWYESAVGRSYCRQKNPGKALKKFNETFKHFNDIAEDQFDFHNYCLRKTTLKTYVAMLRMQERLFSHKFYRRAAKDAINIHLALYDKKSSAGGSAADAAGDGDGEAELSKEEKLKLKHKMKREKKKTEEKKAPEKGPAAAGGGSKPKKVDDDPEGDKFLEKDPMEEACKLVKNLVLFSTLDMATHVLTYECFSRRRLWLHCLQALLQLWNLCGRDSTHYKLIAPLAHFCFVASLEDDEIPAVVREVIMSEVGPILGEKEGSTISGVPAMRALASKIVDRVEQRLKAEPALPVAEVMASLKCMKHAGRDCKTFLSSWTPQGAVALKECRKMLAYLSGEYGVDSPAYTRFKARCQELFPLMVMN
mmetsp:Transcript_60793/g.144847  ORF Transcript_60793/g.144847 Transcript_60793/m.144847 type:complete len:936 (-) Transcript_60793:39-2846(-)